MKRRVFLKGCATSLAGLPSATRLVHAAQAASVDKMPDTSGMSVLFVNIDDVPAAALGCYGNSTVRTPNLDRFATRAIRFTRCYCQATTPRPSRRSFLTGLRPDTTGVLSESDPCDRRLCGEDRSLPEILNQYGFQIANIGKLLDVPQPHSQCGSDSGPLAQQEPDGREARCAAHWLAEMSGQKVSPFFMSVGLSRPHPPLRCPRSYFDLYDLDTISAPQAPVCRDRDIPAVARRFGRNPDFLDDGHEGPVTDETARKTLLAYFACVSFVDAQVGIVLDALDRAGLSNDTIVMIFSNHGVHLGEHGLWGGCTLFEQSTRVPLLVRVPGVTTRQVVCDEIVELVDLLPTLCEMLTVPTPGRLEGTSFVPLLSDPLQPWKRAAFTVCANADHTGRSVRTKRWRYADWQSDVTSLRQFELYDFDVDPWEQTNLAANPEYRNERTILANLLQRGWQAAR